VFFISVGMMVDPAVMMQHWGVIALLAVVVVVGMIVFGTFGMLATGQPLKLAMEAGFSLTQIGEFSFIIASLGTDLGVLDASIYPIIVAVSVITTFTTPFFIKQAVPCYNRLVRVLPANWTRLLEGYSQSAKESETSATRQLWRSIVTRYAVRLVVYSVITVAAIFLCVSYLMPFIVKALGGGSWARIASVAATLAIVSPFIFAIMAPSVKLSERDQLLEQSGKVSYVPFVVMSIISMVVAMAFIMSVLKGAYSSPVAVMVAPLIIIAGVVLSPYLRKRLNRIEKRFISNINERENRRTGHENTLVSDLHLGYMTVGYGCPFVGQRLRNTNLRSTYGVNLVNIQRDGKLHPVPSGDMRIFPGDVLGVIGTEEQIQQMLPLVEAEGNDTSTTANTEARFIHFAIGSSSPLIGKQLQGARLREDYGALLVAVQRGDDEFIQPTTNLTFGDGDILWIVGDPKRLAKLK